MAEIERHRPDVVVVDIRMPPTFTIEGLAAARRVREQYPDVAVMILSQHVDSRYASELLASEQQGVGYLLKDRLVDVVEFVAALERIRAGGTVVDRTLVDELLSCPRVKDPLAGLTTPGVRGPRPPRRGSHRQGHRRLPLSLPQDRRGPRGQHPPQARPPADATETAGSMLSSPSSAPSDSRGCDQVNQRAPRSRVPHHRDGLLVSNQDSTTSGCLGVRMIEGSPDGDRSVAVA